MMEPLSFPAALPLRNSASVSVSRSKSGVHVVQVVCDGTSLLSYSFTFKKQHVCISFTPSKPGVHAGKAVCDKTSLLSFHRLDITVPVGR